MADLDAVVAAVLSSSKYRTVAPEFVQRVAAEELSKHPKPKEAIKAVKNRLHQVAGAYLNAPPITPRGSIGCARQMMPTSGAKSVRA